MDTGQYEKKYNARAAVPDVGLHIARRARESEAVRAALPCVLDIPYGSSPAETLDIYPARGESIATLMFIHGGYWQSQDKKDYAFLVPRLAEAGVTVAIPNYALCPAVRIDEIVMQMVRASAWLHRNAPRHGAPPGRLYVAGASAGGHLAAMMMAVLWPAFDRKLPRRVFRGALCISGIYDLAPIVHVPSVNTNARLTPSSARKVSPLSYPPATDAPVYLTVGSEETEGFKEQLRWMRDRWTDVVEAVIPGPGCHHFNILDQLNDPSSALFRAALGMVRT